MKVTLYKLSPWGAVLEHCFLNYQGPSPLVGDTILANGRWLTVEARFISPEAPGAEGSYELDLYVRPWCPEVPELTALTEDDYRRADKLLAALKKT